ncbi:hypothetical protein A3762_01930 [Oleiphilus sp. HI0125]|uniref:LrgB family protein n=2 Tax=Oleiphilus sp. HI0125 TaxID=1822266 RepID=UPI0007C34CEC|nr:LrgB family protein [Oleiphilus sp. HI0125]KZZ62861.1 hypothetical protein A3762_01930 [Oleiphilus sp. HI0125]
MDFLSNLDATSLLTDLGLILATLATYWLVRKAYVKSGLHPLLQPVLAGSAVMILLLVVLQISYKDYFASVQIIHWFLAPSIVALAVPLFYEAKHMRKILAKISLLVFVGGVATVALAVAILLLFSASDESVLAMLTKSVTTAVAVLVSEETGAIASLAAGFVMITGVFGAVVAPYIFQKFSIKRDEEKGLALGLSAHAIGTVKAFEISPKCGAYSILAMIVNAIFTAILLPICFWLF